jgi:hypothetical protein
MQQELQFLPFKYVMFFFERVCSRLSRSQVAHYSLFYLSICSFVGCTYLLIGRLGTDCCWNVNQQVLSQLCQGDSSICASGRGRVDLSLGSQCRSSSSGTHFECRNLSAGMCKAA